MTEFELIRAYFTPQAVSRADVATGIGDDAAIVRPSAQTELVVTTDVLVAGVHFFEDVDPASLGHKSLAVNLSDLAAMGAEPAWFLLDLTLPKTDTAWLRQFAAGLLALARQHNVQLIGGDTSRGPLSISITVIGSVPPGRALLRSGARVGDFIYVTGELGDAALALAQQRGQGTCSHEEVALLRTRLERPIPRVAEGMALRAIASSAIDVSDGLLADLSHVLQASGVGARIELESVPLSPVYRAHLAEVGWDKALAGGDDYEICFTVAPAKAAPLNALAAQQRVAMTKIGEITARAGLDVRDRAGRAYQPANFGYEHFAAPDPI